MRCPYRDTMHPPCQIAVHPDRHNIEYCRVCEEWRYISDVGDDFPRMFGMLAAIAISTIIFATLLNEMEQHQRREESASYPPISAIPDRAERVSIQSVGGSPSSRDRA